MSYLKDSNSTSKGYYNYLGIWHSSGLIQCYYRHQVVTVVYCSVKFNVDFNVNFNVNLSSIETCAQCHIVRENLGWQAIRGHCRHGQYSMMLCILAISMEPESLCREVEWECSSQVLIDEVIKESRSPQPITHFLHAWDVSLAQHRHWHKGPPI